MTDDPDHTPNRPRIPRKHVVWHGLRVMWLLATLPVVFFVIAAAMMVDREVTAPSWITERIEQRSAEMLAGGRLDFGEITMRMGRDLHPRIQLSETVLLDSNGMPLARVARVSGLMSPRGLLFDQSALVQELALSGAQLDLRRNRDGSVALAFDRGAADVRAAENLPALLEQIDAVFHTPALAALEKVTLDGLVINYSDSRAGRNWTVDGGALELDVRGGQTDLRAEMAVLAGGSFGTLNFRYQSPNDSRSAKVGLNVEGLPARDIAMQSPALSWLGALDAPLSATLESIINENGKLGLLTADLRIGSGALQPGNGAEALGFDAAEVALTYNPSTLRLAFERIMFATDWGTVEGQGQAFAEGLEDGLPTALIGQFHMPQLALNPAGLYPQAIKIGDVTIGMRLHLDPFRVEVGQLVAASDQGTVVAEGSAELAAQGWVAALDVHVDQLKRERLMRLWPTDRIVGVRQWFDNAMIKGRITDLQVGWRKSPEIPGRMAAQFAFDQTDVQVMRTMPVVRGGAGTAHFIDDRFVLSVSKGYASAAEGGGIDLAGSDLVIPDLLIKNAPITLNLRMDSSITAGLSVLNQPPFKFLDKAGLPVTLADGRATTNAKLRFRLRKKVLKEEFFYDVAADLRRVSSTRLVPNRTLNGTGLSVEASNAQLSISGPVRVDGVPATGTWTQVMGQKGSQVVARMTLTQDALSTFDVALPPGTVSGEGHGDLVLNLRKGRPPSYRLTSDLHGLGLSIPQLGWQKGRRTAGSLELSGRLGPRPVIDALTIRADGLLARGSVTLAQGGGLAAARFDRVQVGNWLDAPVTLRGRGKGRPIAVDVNGGMIDLRRAKLGGPARGEGGPLAVTLDRLQVTEGIALRGFRGEFATTGGLGGNFTARINDGPGVRGTIAPQNGRTAVRLQSDDAGGAVRAAGLLKNGVGGDIDLTLIPAGPAGNFDGVLAIRQIRVRDAPSIAALLDAISVVGLLQQLDGQGLAFEEVDARFRLTPQQVIVTQSSAVGPGLGISLDGIYTLANKSFDFQGVVSPFYILNSIGSFLTRRGEGLIGFNFTIKGTSDAPKVAVNPLSALTPGMFREIFRRAPPQVNQ